MGIIRHKDVNKWLTKTHPIYTNNTTFFLLGQEFHCHCWSFPDFVSILLSLFFRFFTSALYKHLFCTGTDTVHTI